MIKELIISEEKKILQELNEYEKTKNKYEKFKKREIELNEIIQKTDYLNVNVPIPVRKQKFNIFQKIFSRKYREYTKAIEEYEIKLKAAEKENEKMNQENNKAKEELKNIKIDIAKQESVMSKVDSIGLRQKFSELKDDKKAVKLFLESNNELAENVEFMKEAIEIDETYIIYDKTDDPQIYVEILERNKNRYTGNSMNKEWNEKIQKEYRDEITKIQKEILNPKAVQDGKYKIPVKYIFEAIREDIKGGNNDLTLPLNTTRMFFEYDGVFPKEFGEKMQEMWEDTENVFAVHGVSRNYDSCNPDPSLDESIEKNISSIFENGLMATNALGQLSEENSNPTLEQTTYSKGTAGFCFMRALDYSYAGSYGYIIMQIPKNGLGEDANMAIWGTKTKDTDRREKVYLLPKYIKGFVKNNRHIQKGVYSIRENDCKNKTIYPYFLMDSSYKGVGETLSSEVCTKIEEKARD